MKKQLFGGIMITVLCIGLLTGCNGGTKMPDYSDYVTLGDYVGLEYEPLSQEVTDEEMQAQIDYFLSQMGETTELTEGTVKNGDTINLDYIGYVDGEAFEGGSTDGAGTELTIGSHRYIDDFEEQLIGHEVGEEGIEVQVTFPDDYKNADGTPNELAGKDATFVCKINSIYQTTQPEELTDELVAANTSYGTVNSFLDALKMDYETYKAQQADAQMRADLITAAIENATVNGYPEDEVHELLEMTLNGAKETAVANNLTYEGYLAMLQDASGRPYTQETYEADAEEYVRKLLVEKMVVCLIAEQEGFKATKQEIDDYVQKEVEGNTAIEEEQMYELYTTEDLAYAVIYDKVMDFLIENAIAI